LSKISKRFYFFIEVQNSLGQVTPFNLLPKEWANFHFPIEVAALLPYNNENLSYGWAYLDNLYKNTPIINFYSPEHVNDIQKFMQRDVSNNIFFASEVYSVDLIKNNVKPDSTIVVTENDNYEKLLKNYPIILVKNKSSNQIIEEIYQEVLNILKQYKTSDNKDIQIHDFKDAYIIKKKFLPNIEIESNLICRSNKIVLSRMRGKLPKYLNLCHNENLELKELNSELKELYITNESLVGEIISEKSTDYFLSLYSNGKKPTKIPAYLLKKAKKLVKDNSTYSDQRKAREYKAIKKEILNLHNLSLNQEVILLIPSVNIACRNNITNKLSVEFNEKYNTEIEEVIKGILKGGRGIPLLVPASIQEKDVETFKDMVFSLGNTRKAENCFLTSLVSLYASRKLSPVIKTTTIPSNVFIKLNLARYQIKNRKPNETITSYFSQIQFELKKTFPDNYYKLISDLNVNKYTIFSDIPFELTLVGNSEAFCQKYEVTRIPITPLKLMLSAVNNCNLPPHIIELSSFNDILHINSISEEDPIFNEYNSFKKTCEELNYNLNFKSVKKSAEFISLINKIKPNILIYYGHATYNDDRDEGQLIFETDNLSFESLKKITDMPQIVFLVGCETASTSAFIGGIANHFLSTGVQAILATLFPIPGNHAASFIGRILGMIEEYKKAGSNCSLAKLVFKARKLG
jgi:hypothetical protein